MRGMKLDSIYETIKTPVMGNYDLIIAGGGIGGICAAISAKRNGVERVLILENPCCSAVLRLLGLSAGMNRSVMVTAGNLCMVWLMN